MNRLSTQIKIFIYLIVLCVFFTLTGCQLDNSTKEPSSPGKSSTEDNTSEISDSTEVLKQSISPEDGDTKDLLWTKFLYAYGYGFDELMTECLDAYIKIGEDYDAILVDAASLFITEIDKHGYQSGCVIAYFENFTTHPTLMEGDIIVAIDGIPIDNGDDISEIKQNSSSSTWEFTILRADDHNILQELMVDVHEDDPLAGNRPITPLTLE